VRRSARAESRKKYPANGRVLSVVMVVVIVMMVVVVMVVMMIRIGER
jgi:hypothetical protein